MPQELFYELVIWMRYSGPCGRSAFYASPPLGRFTDENSNKIGGPNGNEAKTRMPGRQNKTTDGEQNDPARRDQADGRPGQTHLISAFADLLFDGIIRQNQPFWRWRRHLALFAAHVLEYIPRKKHHFPCQRRKILVFRILPAPAIRLRFAPAEQRWLYPTP